MALDKQSLERLRALPRADFVRLLRQANDVGATDDSVSGAPDPESMRAVWNTVFACERELLFPPFDRPPFQFPDQAAGKKRVPGRLRLLRQPVLQMAAALAIFLVGAAAAWLVGQADFTREPGVRNVQIQKEIVAPEALRGGRLLSAPAAIRGEFGSIELIRGALHAVWASETQSLVAIDLAADFVLDRPLKMHLRHPAGGLKVTGTSFALDLQPGGGTIRLREGSIEWYGIGQDGIRRVAVQAPARLFVDAHRILRIDEAARFPGVPNESRRDSGPADFPDGVTIQRFRLIDGSTVVGFVVRGTGSELIVQTRGGAQRGIRKADLVSSENALR